MAQEVARSIIENCDPAKQAFAREADWELEVHKVARTAILPYLSPIDELIVVRADMPNRFWFVARRLASAEIVFVNIQSIREHICTGTNTAALFLPRHLYRPNKTVAQLKRLAALTLSYATDEEPGAVGPPFDILTLYQSGQFEWSVETQRQNGDFQDGLEKLLSAFAIS